MTSVEYERCGMPRKKASNVIADVFASAEILRKDIGALPTEIRDKIRDLALAMISQPVKRRGRPQKKAGRPRKRGGPRKPKAEAPAQA
jgi:hypothetical protein